MVASGSVDVALLGTGTMGAGMARNIVRGGHGLRVWNRTRAKAEGLGADVAATPAEAVADAGVAITMLADGPAVEAVMGEALPAMRPDAVWVQMSTVGAEWIDRLAALADEHGVVLVDAPVMGSRPQAEEGKLFPLVSGPGEARGRVTPVLESFSRGLLWVGEEAGLGTRLKLVGNHWVLVCVETLAETLALGDALGLDPHRFFELISGAAFDMQYAHWKGKMMVDREFPAAFALRLARKDVGLALAAAECAGLELPLAEATFERFGQAIELGHGDEDTAATYLAARREA